MIFDGKTAAQITAAEIHSLVEERVQEDQFLDFKRDPYSSSDAERREMIKDVSAFANAAGGYIIIGISEDGEGRASEIVGVLDPQEVRSAFLDRCLTLIEPRLTGLDVGIVDVDDRSVVVCHVPESDWKPHAAVPDREHHTFYKRYQDGVKVMTVAELREAFQGDVVLRKIAELQQALASILHRETVQQELEQDVDERGMLELESIDAFAHHAERLFRIRGGERPYFRITATPVPLRGLNLRERSDRLHELLCDPPMYRVHGFDIGHRYDPRICRTAWGLERPVYDAKHLRLLWNGHLEFWNVADDDWISWGEATGLPVAERSLAPLSLVESTASFVLLAKRIAEIGDFTGEVTFGLGLYRVRGRRILPYAQGTLGHIRAAGYPAGKGEIGVFSEQDASVGPVREQVANLPGTVAFQLISAVYRRLGYSREHIPHFDDQGRCVYDVEAEQREQGGEVT